MELCSKHGIPVSEQSCLGTDGPQLGGVFCTLSSIGIAEATVFDGVNINRSAQVFQLHQRYVEQVLLECPR